MSRMVSLRMHRVYRNDRAGERSVIQLSKMWLERPGTYQTREEIVVFKSFYKLRWSFFRRRTQEEDLDLLIIAVITILIVVVIVSINVLIIIIIIAK